MLQTFSKRCTSPCSLLTACEMTRKVARSKRTTWLGLGLGLGLGSGLGSGFEGDHLVRVADAAQPLELRRERLSVRDERVHLVGVGVGVGVGIGVRVEVGLGLGLRLG